MMIVNLVNQKRNQGRGNKMMRKIKIAIYKVYYTAGLHHYRYIDIIAVWSIIK